MQIQSLGAVDYMIPELDPNYLGDHLGGELEDAGRDLALSKSLTAEELASVLRPQAPSSRDVIAASFVANGGDVALLNAALGMLTGFGPGSPARRNFSLAWKVFGTASMAAGVYHGYKRNQSVGWALWWGLMGGMFPVVVPVIAVAQGFGKTK